MQLVCTTLIPEPFASLMFYTVLAVLAVYPSLRSVEKSWSYFYTVLKSNTIYFYKDAKHYKRNEFESACDLTGDSRVDLESAGKVHHSHFPPSNG